LSDVEVERYFNYACVWAFGGTLAPEGKEIFSSWWKETFEQHIDYPGDGSVSSQQTIINSVDYYTCTYDLISLIRLNQPKKIISPPLSSRYLTTWLTMIHMSL